MNSRICITALMASTILAMPVQAAPCITAAPSIAPADCSYIGWRSQSRASFSDGMSSYNFSGFRLGFAPPPPGPPPPGGIASFFDVFVEIDFGPLIPLSGVGLFDSGPSLPQQPLPPGGPVPIELLAMDLVSVPFMLRESPTEQSMGEIEVTDLGSGLYQVDSFFDVFVELSLDGGLSWLPQSQANRGLRLQLQSNSVPETTSSVLAALGLFAVARRRRTA
jgi:hypothetical protein